MTRDKEDQIIRQAQDIIERRMAVEKDIKINLHNLVYYGAYYQGALDAATRLISYIMQNYRADEKVYIKSELDLITQSKRSMQLFLDGTPIRYRNHKSDKKGKLESCECYFVEYKQTIEEVK